MSKKTKIILAIVGSALLLYTVIIYAIFPMDNNDDTTQQETEIETAQKYEGKTPIYKISIDNLEENAYYSLDIGESFYIYVKPHYYSVTENSKPSSDDISLIATTNPSALKIKFIEICPNGSFLYKVTSAKEGYIDIVAIDYEGRNETNPICIVVADYSKHSEKTRYVITLADDKFHLPNCEIVSRVNLKDRLRPNLTRRELRDQGYVPCRDCCG